MGLDEPGSGDFFTAKEPSIPDLTKLVSAESFIAETSFRVQQFGVWIITDNPARDKFVRLQTIGSGSGPSDEELRRIRQLFDEAGIPTSGYRAFN